MPTGDPQSRPAWEVRTALTSSQGANASTSEQGCYPSRTPLSAGHTMSRWPDQASFQTKALSKEAYKELIYIYMGEEAESPRPAKPVDCTSPAPACSVRNCTRILGGFFRAVQTWAPPTQTLPNREKQNYKICSGAGHVFFPRRRVRSQRTLACPHWQCPVQQATHSGHRLLFQTALRLLLFVAGPLRTLRVADEDTVGRALAAAAQASSGVA